MTRVVRDEDRPWLPLDPAGENFMKILSVDEKSRQVVLVVKFAPHAVYPKHLHAASAVAYTVEGQWEYEEGVLSKGSCAVEPPGTEHTPLISSQGATIFAVLKSVDENFVEVPLDDGTTLKQDFAYFNRMYHMTPDEMAREAGMQVPMTTSQS